MLAVFMPLSFKIILVFHRPLSIFVFDLPRLCLASSVDHLQDACSYVSHLVHHQHMPDGNCFGQISNTLCETIYYFHSIANNLHEFHRCPMAFSFCPIHHEKAVFGAQHLQQGQQPFYHYTEGVACGTSLNHC